MTAPRTTHHADTNPHSPHHSKHKNSTKVHTVEALQEHVQDLFSKSGDKTRFVLKYRACDAKLSLRVTDDKKTAKYRTRRQAELGKVKRLVGVAITGKADLGLGGSNNHSNAMVESPTRARKGGKKAKKG